MASNTDSSTAFRVLQGVLLTAVVGVGAANLYLLLQTRESADTTTETEALVSTPRNMNSAPIFVNVGPLTVNLESDTYGQRLLYVGLTLQVNDFETRDMLTRHMPEVQSRLLMMLSGQSASELIPAAGKQKLAQDIKDMFASPLAQAQSPAEINAVLFTNFIVQ